MPSGPRAQGRWRDCMGWHNRCSDDIEYPVNLPDRRQVDAFRKQYDAFISSIIAPCFSGGCWWRVSFCRWRLVSPVGIYIRPSAAFPTRPPCKQPARCPAQRPSSTSKAGTRSRSSRSSASTCRSRACRRTSCSAIVAIEDQRFYDHGGVDVIRIAGAALNNVRRGARAQGGSTLTQQLARQSFLTPDKTFRRKLQEVIVAARLERAFTKDEILELYLNKVYFGDGLYGVEAAVARLLRQARRRPRRRRGGAARRPGQVAVERTRRRST